MSTNDILALRLAPDDTPDSDREEFEFKGVGGGEAAAINGASVIAFAAGIDSQTQEDILYSIQIANRAADGVAKAGEDMAAWFGEYARVLRLTGWTVTGIAPQQQTTSEGDVELAKEALGIITAAIGGALPVVLAAAISAMQKMADSSGFIKLFDHYGNKGKIGNFQLGQVDRGVGGDIGMTAGAFFMTLTEKRENFIFIKWHSKDVTIWADVQKNVFSKSQYANVRAAVIKKLGENANAAIADLNLG